MYVTLRQAGHHHHQFCAGHKNAAATLQSLMNPKPN